MHRIQKHNHRSHARCARDASRPGRDRRAVVRLEVFLGILCSQSTRQPGRGIAQDFAVADAQRLDPPLPSKGDTDEVAELDQLLLTEVLVQLGPQGVVR